MTIGGEQPSPAAVPEAPGVRPAVAAPTGADVGRLGRVHFVGIGGVGMSAVARLLRARGIPVSGSDLSDSKRLVALRAVGVRTMIGHAPANVDGADTVVYTPTAVRDTHPEVVEARRRGLPVLLRADVLAALMRDKRSVAVAGSHGKTTTTSMLVRVLQHAGGDPSFAIGADLREPGSNSHAGSGELFVAEADESDRSFLLLSPYAAVVTNVDLDHPTTFPDQAAYEQAFEEFLGCIHPDGVLVCCPDDPPGARLSAAAQRRGLRVRTYGLRPHSDVVVHRLRLLPGGSVFDLVAGGQRLGEVALDVRGAHNAVNAAGALTMATELGQPFERLVGGLAGFTGARRRFEWRGEVGGVQVFDDYCLHPTEVAAVLRAARTAAGPDGRVVVAFQPHRFSRTAVFAREHGRALGLADQVVVLEVYPEFEDPIPGVTGAAVAAAVPLPADLVTFEPSWSEAVQVVAGLVRPGDVVLTLGAAEMAIFGPALLNALASRMDA